MPTKNIDEIVIREFATSWKGTSLGWVQNADLSGLKIIKVEKKIEEIGNYVIDRVIVGHGGTIKTLHKQVKRATYQQLLPSGTTAASMPLMPSSLYVSDYAAAGVLNLHPTAMGSDVSEDFNFIKAAPELGFPKSSEGKEFMTLPAEWNIYPDQTQLIAGLYVIGYIGPIPS